jgi:hypothetical protein
VVRSRQLQPRHNCVAVCVHERSSPRAPDVADAALWHVHRVIGADASCLCPHLCLWLGVSS